jgi:hypothetical protein
MKTLLSLIAMSLLAVGLFAASIDGKWKVETTMPQGRGKGGGRTFTTILDLKSDGAKLAGTVTIQAPGGDRTTEIQDGKIDGDKFSFTTVQQTRQGEMKVMWEGTLSGDELKGTRKREGGGRGLEFTAKRQ